MRLDTTSLERAVSSLESGYARHLEQPADELARDGVVQRFEYTYELVVKFVRRQVAEDAADPESVRSAGFADVVRSGLASGLLASSVEEWRRFRDLRARTSHTYDEAEAAKVVRAVPGLLAEARHLLERLR